MPNYFNLDSQANIVEKRLIFSTDKYFIQTNLVSVKRRR